MFGLALDTTAVWVVFDAVFLARKTTDEAYQKWAWGFARKLYTLGMFWAAAAGAWYVFGTWSEELRTKMFGSAVAGVDRRHGRRHGPALGAADDRRLVPGEAGHRGGDRPLPDSACSASTPSAGRSCRT